MKVIDQDPEQYIPNICEKYKNQNIVLCELIARENGNIYIGTLTEEGRSKCTFRGNILEDIKYGIGSRRDPLLMRFTHNDYNSLCEALIGTYNYNYRTFHVRFYIFENSHEIFEYMKCKGIV